MKGWKWWQKGLVGVVGVLVVAAAYIFWPQGVWPFVINLDDIAPPPGAYDATILRDEWGVPHIFGQTDADAAYGLAYAHAEDDFVTIQDTLLAANQLAGRVHGRDAAPIDYFVHLLRIWDTVNAHYATIAPEDRAILQAYADGINHYASLHEAEVLTADLFPLTGEDIAAANMLVVPVFFGLDTAVGNLFAGPPEDAPSGSSSCLLPPVCVDTAYGSNVFAISPARSANGETLLAINSHQPWSGPAAWYEAHLHSQEGLNVIGGLFPGSPLVILGHNEHLGWSFTVNHPDLVDTYRLEINPDNPDQYRFDGEWLDLDVRQVTLWVQIVGRLVIPVRQETLWSVYGPTVRQDHGTYALRYASMGDVNLLTQFRHMNKATNFAEWQTAMREGGLPMFNTGYADADGNIYYVYNARLPLRAEGYDWRGILPGNTSETLWTAYLPFDDLPQVLNPASGFVQNANSTPFQTTIGPENPAAVDYSPVFGIENFMTNRALQLLDLFTADQAITPEEFNTIKYNMGYHPESDVARVAEMLAANPPAGDENVAAAADLLADWDLQATPESEATAVIVMTFYYLNQSDAVDLNPSRLVGTEIPLAVAQDAFLQAVDWLVTHFGRVAVPWQEVNRLVRGSVDVGMGGGPDIIHAVYGQLQEDGRLHGFVGDSYVMLVQWDGDGRLTSQSIHQFGSATSHPESPHYADQAPLFANRQLKPVWLTEADIRAHLEREYRPGD
ncbi:MAG: acylase [Chloroflexi bacterium]|nr:acylase [Ardenticatenaceae bacterium]NOG34038.1 acylase [Chloroflexota bacterium]GIK54456.1 MAG: penicillin amidase [Chloroflexota bacterium]